MNEEMMAMMNLGGAGMEKSGESTSKKPIKMIVAKKTATKKIEPKAKTKTKTKVKKKK